MLRKRWVTHHITSQLTCYSKDESHITDMRISNALHHSHERHRGGGETGS